MTMNDYYNIVLEGMDEAVYKEIAKSLQATVSSLPALQKSSQSSFTETEMDRLLQYADAYGKATIYCPFEFAATMLPNNNSGTWASWSDSMKNQVWNNGYFANYKGHNVIILPQSYEDITSTDAKKVINPGYAYIIPTGAEKPVKVAFEGSAQVKSFDNRDWSTELQTYQKLGVATYLINPGFCVYCNTTLAAKPNLINNG